MNNKRNIYFYIVVFALLSGLVSETKALTTDELADICKKMESGIVDISIEYEWRTVPPWTFEEVDKNVGPGMPVGICKDGYSKCRLTAASLPSLHDSNDPNFPLIDGALFEESKTLINREGTTHDSLLKLSWIGRISKRLDIQTVPKSVCTGVISYVERSYFPDNFSMLLSPIGFSVHRLSFSKISAHKPLSVVLRELGRLDNTIRQINGFQAVRVDILQQSTIPLPVVKTKNRRI